MPQAMKIPAAKAAVDKEWEKLEKFSAWNLAKLRSKKEVIDEARTKGAKVHFASLMDMCHLKNAELEAKHQKYNGRVVLRGDIVKDDSGFCAVSTEQGSSASQMTAAKFMDIISRLPGCVGQAADAVSAKTKVKMKDAPKLLKTPKIGMSRHLDSSAMGKAIWENPIGIWNAYSHTVKKELFLSVYVDDIKVVDDIKLARRKQKHWSDVEGTQ